MGITADFTIYHGIRYFMYYHTVIITAAGAVKDTNTYYHMV